MTMPFEQGYLVVGHIRGAFGSSVVHWPLNAGNAIGSRHLLRAGTRAAIENVRHAY